MSDTCCGICGLNVEEEARIECTCTRADCATASYHVPCIEDYVQRNFKNGPSKTRFNVRATVASRVKPWKDLEYGMRCPAGSYTLTRAATDAEAAAHLAAGRLPPAACEGKVVSAALVDVQLSKKKKTKAAAPLPAPAPFVRGAKRTGAAAAAAVAQAQPAPKTRAAAPPATAPALPTPPARSTRARAETGSAMSLAKAKAFLGVGSDDEDDGAGGGGRSPQPSHSQDPPRADRMTKPLPPPKPAWGAAAEPRPRPRPRPAATARDANSYASLFPAEADPDRDTASISASEAGLSRTFSSVSTRVSTRPAPASAREPEWEPAGQHPRRAARRHDQAPGPGLRFLAGRRPNSLLLCGHYRHMGRCPVVNCEYAHGEAEQREREAAWAQGEGERRAAREEEAAREREQQCAALPQQSRFEGDARMGGPAPGRAFGGGEGGLDAGISQEAAGAQQRRDRLEVCRLQLLELGFDDFVATAAAARADGDAAAAVAAAVEDNLEPAPQAPPPSYPPPPAGGHIAEAPAGGEEGWAPPGGGGGGEWAPARDGWAPAPDASPPHLPHSGAAPEQPLAFGAAAAAGGWALTPAPALPLAAPAEPQWGGPQGAQQANTEASSGDAEAEEMAALLAMLGVGS